MANSTRQSFEESIIEELDSIYQEASESSFFPSQDSEELDEVKKGRPKTDRSAFFELFFRINENSFKIDTLRAKIIRSLKKSIRAILAYLRNSKDQGLNPDHTMFMGKNRQRSILHQLDPKKPSDIDRWKMLALYVKNYKKFFNIKSRCANEPGKGKKNNKHKCFSSGFCKEFLHDEKMREYLTLYLDLVFNDRSPSEYVRRFNMQCCLSGHTDDCYPIWDDLKGYIKSILLID